MNNAHLFSIRILATHFALCGSIATHTHAAEQPPNLVVVLTDDQGWGDLSVHGNTNLQTPNIDSLARDGAQFERFFVCPVCSPTRAELLTGRYHPRGGVYSTSTGGERLDLDETTIADIFKQAGYATGAFGKWHNGMQYPYHPNGRGFDEFYGFCSGHWGNYFSPVLEHNGKLVRGNGYIIDDLTDRAIEFIGQNRQRPLLCYVAFNTPHSPMQVPDRFWDKFQHRELKMRYVAAGPQVPVSAKTTRSSPTKGRGASPNRAAELEDPMMTRAALAMCESIDENVGRILQALDQWNLADNTIVVYLSDNGPNSWRFNGGMKGRKGSTDEGGIRVPCLVRWPGQIPAGRKIPQIAAAIDLLPTLTDLAGIHPPRVGRVSNPPPSSVGRVSNPSLSPVGRVSNPSSSSNPPPPNRPAPQNPLDGISLKPLLLDPPQRQPPRTSTADWPDRMIFSHWRGRVSVRTQRYRLDHAGRLYDMTRDPGQAHDVASDRADVHARLSEAAKSWSKELLPGLTEDDRPFPVGYAEFPVAHLPARDGQPHGNIQRSARAPNCSFFTNWTSTDDRITWDIQVAAPGEYKAVIHYTCPAKDVGSTIALSAGDSRVEARVAAAHDPPLRGAAHDRVPRRGESYVKDFRPMPLGVLTLQPGRKTLTLQATNIPGQQVMDVRYVVLTRTNATKLP